MSEDLLSKRKRWIALLILTLMYTLHVVDRGVMSVVLEPLRHEFNLSDSALGAIGGLAHALAYSTFVLPLGWLIDRTNRVRLLSILLATWSLLTALGAVANSYVALFAMRMGVGAAEAGSSPASMSIIGGLFPPRERTTAMGFFLSSTAIGTGIVFLLGSYIAQEYGWRMVFLIAGAPGLVVALLLWRFVPEPPRVYGETEPSKVKPPGLWSVAKMFFRTPPILFSVAGMTVASMTVGSTWVWISPYLIRLHDLSLAQAGLVVGISAGVLKAVSTAASGWLADRIAKGRVDRLWVVPTIALACSAPIAVAMSLTTSPTVAIALVLVLGLFLGTHYAPPRALIISIAPDNMRGQVSAIAQLLMNLLGVGMGPLITGRISDAFGGGDAIALALGATLSLNLVAALFFWLSSRGAREAEAARAGAQPA